MKQFNQLFPTIILKPEQKLVTAIITSVTAIITTDPSIRGQIQLVPIRPWTKDPKMQKDFHFWLPQVSGSSRIHKSTDNGLLKTFEVDSDFFSTETN